MRNWQTVYVYRWMNDLQWIDCRRVGQMKVETPQVNKNYRSYGRPYGTQYLLVIAEWYDDLSDIPIRSIIFFSDEAT